MRIPATCTRIERMNAFDEALLRNTYKLPTPTGYKWNKTDPLSLMISIYREKARYLCNTNSMSPLLDYSIATQ